MIVNRIFLLLLIILVSTPGFAKVNLKAGLFLGYGYSAFEDQLQTANSLPLGGSIHFEMKPEIDLLLTYETTLFPFIFEYGEGDQKTLETKTTQNILALHARYRFSFDMLEPYLQLGVGRYTGRFKYHPIRVGIKQEADFKPAIGFSAGMGFEYPVHSQVNFNGNFMFHLVQRQLDQPDADKYGYNNYIFNAGFIYKLRE